MISIQSRTKILDKFTNSSQVGHSIQSYTVITNIESFIWAKEAWEIGSNSKCFFPSSSID